MAFRGDDSDLVYISLDNYNGKTQINAEDEVKDREISINTNFEEVLLSLFMMQIVNYSIIRIL